MKLPLDYTKVKTKKLASTNSLQLKMKKNRTTNINRKCWQLREIFLVMTVMVQIWVKKNLVKERANLETWGKLVNTNINLLEEVLEEVFRQEVGIMRMIKKNLFLKNL